MIPAAMLYRITVGTFHGRYHIDSTAAIGSFATAQHAKKMRN